MAAPKSPASKNQRHPAPSLFVGPPSRNASATSLLPSTNTTTAPTSTPGPRAPLPRNPSRLRTETISPTSAVDAQSSSGASASMLSATDVKPSPFCRRQPPTMMPMPIPSLQSPIQDSSGPAPALAKAGIGGGIDAKGKSRTDAIWTEMQNTLMEVDLNSVSGSHFFSKRHAKALDELRAAQIKLAQAWARSEADEETMRGQEVESLRQGKEEQQKGGGLSHDETPAGGRPRKMSMPGSRGGTADGVGGTSFGGRERSGTGASGESGAGRSGSADTRMEQETENDILLARRRREANDRYFQWAKAGVQDVVAKLEEVKEAIKGVEVESREMWDDRRRESLTESVTTGSVT